MSLDRRKPLDHAFLESMRERIEVSHIVDKLQGHVKDPEHTPLLNTQLKAAEILLRKVMPDQKAVEHTDERKRDLTREELIERLTALHARPAANFERQPAQGDAAVVDGNKVSH